MNNKGYGYFRFKDKEGNEVVRKPTRQQRKIMLMYYFRRRSGRTISISSIAKAFYVSERTIQKLLKELETEKIIIREPVYNESGLQTANRIIYIGDRSRLSGKECTIEKVYDLDNPLKLRDFEWAGYWTMKDKEYAFFHYEELFGCEGPSAALNALAEKHGYVATDSYTGEQITKLNKKKRT